MIAGGAGTLYVMVGLPGAGKTTRAHALAAEKRALRLTPDEWMLPLFAAPEAGGKRDVLEGRLLWLALEALRLGTSVVLDFGVWARVERSALKYLAATVGAECRLLYVPVEPREQRRRILARNVRADGAAFSITEEELVRFRGQFEEPDAVELRSPDAGPPPAGYGSWEQWVIARWPTALAPPPG